MDDLLSIYIDDTKEFLAILNESIIAYEKHPVEKAAISEMFRAYHTMKSSTAAMDFKHTAEFIHHMEDLLHEMREDRIQFDEKIIEFLYESYDYLEKFIHIVLESGSEGSLPYDHLIKKVEGFIRKQSGLCSYEESSGEPAADNGAGMTFIPGESTFPEIKKEASEGRQLYKITVELTEDCSFRAVRAWMIFEDVSKIVKIIDSQPLKPDSDNFLNGSFCFNDTGIFILAASDIPLSDIFQELTLNLNEIDGLLIEEIIPEFEAGTAFEGLPVVDGQTMYYKRRQEENVSRVVEQIIEEDEGRNNSGLQPDVLAEMLEKIKECELLLIELEMEKEHTEILTGIMDRFQAVMEISAYVGGNILHELIQKACGLMELFVHQKLEPDVLSVGLMADFLGLIKRLCEKPELNSNSYFLDEVKQKEDLLNSYDLTADNRQCTGKEPAKLGEILVKTGSMRNEDVTEIIRLQKQQYPDLKFGQIAVMESKAETRDVLGALNVQESMKTNQKNQSYIRIPASKVDNLVDHLGELLITQSLHKQEVLSLPNKDGGRILNNIIRMERIAKEIQDITMSLRMVSLKQTFQKIYRIGRDTAVELGKEVVIDTLGDETEIDRNIVDKIHDPLMHLIRNAISHGIEETEEREKAGKPAAGHVTISASNRKGNVYIEIDDDGQGLSADKIYKKAVEKELVEPSKKYTEEEILKFIYLPGFSTQVKVNNISGRGVGMNVVQTEIAKLGGKIDIENRAGQGCSFILKIPVNLATINGTIVEISGGKYIIPTLNIKQILKPEEDQWVSFMGVESSIMIRNEILPVIPIENILRTEADNDDRHSGIIIIVEYERKLMALPVKTILGKQEIVVKQLGGDFSNLDFISGATILGDGRVSLILDVESLFKLSEESAKVS